ncbi:hypothetical protein FDN13_13875 [Caloramator sp. E03]|uniref:DNA methyltransferase n=1 Tax=Caloramator sp. E03 TaxID=2576307 RepID=UPI0011109FA2|nr:DNA methyltransferase [Caloramator sp. E03]QCX34702.1 hypothetical protein FDN13_13875 [Caloramator sp. E03]
MEEIVKAETYKGLYGMHKYWGKKPFNVICEFIKKYSKEGDIVLDSFCGSGITLIEALKLNRRAVGFDLNPIAIMLTKASLKRVDIKILKKEFEEIKKELEPLINSLYETTCEKCGGIAYETHVIWNKGEPQEVWYKCDNCKLKKVIRKGNDYDKEQCENPRIKPLWYPTTAMFENSRLNVREGQTVADLFTNRAIVALSYLLDRIKRVKDPIIKETFEITFTGALSQASKLVFVIRRRNKNSTSGKEETGRAEVGSWVVGYWIPEEHFEINVWNCFENRFKKILKGKEDVNKTFSKEIAFYDEFNSLKYSKSGALILNASATDIDIPDNSIDYVFIDPPHGNRILYMEMSLMWNSWLGLEFNCDWENEIVVSEAKYRNKNVDSYSKMMNLALLEIKRVLKYGCYFSLAFNSLDDETWLEMLNMCIGTGFNVVDISPLGYSANSVVQDNRKNALKTDFVITCKKILNQKQKE